MKKKILASILAAGMVASLAACGGAASSGGDSAAASSAAASSAAEATSEAADDAAAEATDDAAAEDAGSEDSETDIMYTKADIEAAADGLGDWEADYDMPISGDEAFTWGYIDMGFKDTFTTKIRNTFKYYCQLNFPNVTINEGDGEMDPNRQLQLAENFITQGVDAIILDPTDADGCLGIVELCQEAKMPLVLVNAIVHTDAMNNGIGFVGSDNYYAGQLEAEWIINNVDDSETVNMCYQRGQEGYDHTELRQKGVFETLDKAGFNYDLKAVLISDYMRDKAMNNAEDWTNSFGEDIKVIPCCNDESAMGTLQAYQAAGLADGVKILGIDANQDALQEVKNGNLACTVFQNGLAQAKWAAASAYDACVNGTVETKGVDVPFELVDATNIDDYL